jgi:hypothetical protein
MRLPIAGSAGRRGHLRTRSVTSGYRAAPPPPESNRPPLRAGEFALASRDVAVARADTEDRSAYIPDHAYWALSRTPVLLIIPEPECPHRRERFYRAFPIMSTYSPSTAETTILRIPLGLLNRYSTKCSRSGCKGEQFLW